MSLPTWQDNIDYLENVPRVCNTLNIGYPRFVVHIRVRQLAKICLTQLGIDTNKYDALPLLTEEATEWCRDFIIRQRTINHSNTKKADIGTSTADISTNKCTFGPHTVYIVIYPTEDSRLAKAFWQNTGNCISSRFADCCLNEVGVLTSHVSLGCNIDPIVAAEKEPIHDYLPKDQIGTAKQLIKQRITNVIHATYSDNNHASTEFIRNHPNALALTEDNVYLYPGGMNVIFFTHRILSEMHPERKSICFG